MAIKVSSVANTKKSAPSKLSQEEIKALIGVILLLLIVVGLPLFFSIWYIGTPIKELN